MPQSSDPRELTDVGGVLYFTADDGDLGRELWKSEGTPGGTVMVEEHQHERPYDPTASTTRRSS